MKNEGMDTSNKLVCANRAEAEPGYAEGLDCT